MTTNVPPAVYFVEHVTLRCLVGAVAWRVLGSRLRRSGEGVRCYALEGSPVALAAGRLVGRLIGARWEKLAYDLTSIRDARGRLVWLRVGYDDLSAVQADVTAERAFRDVVAGDATAKRLGTYLAKSMAINPFNEAGAVWRALIVLNLVAWKMGCEGRPAGSGTVFLERRPWSGALERHASRNGIRVIWVRRRMTPRGVAKGVLGPRGLALVRSLRARMRRRASPRVEASPELRHGTQEPKRELVGDTMAPSAPRLAVECMEYLNLEAPQLHSEVFFWGRSPISSQDLVLLLRPAVDAQDLETIRRHDIAAVALSPEAVVDGVVPPFRWHPPAAATGSAELVPARASDDAKWLAQQTHIYRITRSYWQALFERCGAKVYATWYRYDASHCAIADAMEALGGVTALYQRAYHPAVGPELIIDADVMFGYSPQDALAERAGGSRIRYHVAVGYLGDYRFPVVRDAARTLRAQLQQRGAKRIACFFDENSTVGPWLLGHGYTRRNYAFLLERVLAEPWFGLVLKPKVHGTLRQRLGPVAELLRKAEATGRCFVFESGPLRSADPPAVAALAADVAIHGHVCAATAAVEAALTGRPTLVMDPEGWPVSPLYRLGVGRVVFTDWDMLWTRCVEHWARPEGAPGFGDWSPMLDELDPFRDGRAAERVGTYLQWLVEGFKRGLDRDEAMASAAERYGAVWGMNNISEVGPRA